MFIVGSLECHHKTLGRFFRTSYCFSIAGVEDVIREHFRLQRLAVLKQCSDWLHESEAGDEERKLKAVINELRSEFAKQFDSEK